MNKTCSIIIIHWNTPDLLKNQLQALLPLPLTVVDNASEKSLSEIMKKNPSVQWIQNITNEGYARAANQGALRKTTPWLLFLNPDVTLNKEMVDELINTAKINGYDACSPEPKTSDYKKPIPTWRTLCIEFTPLKHFLYKLLLRTSKRHTLTGGCLLIKRSVFEAIGGFDERYFLWFEDSDLTKRLIEKGYRIGWCDLPVEHAGGAAFSKISTEEKRNIFFHSLAVYGRIHEKAVGQWILNRIKRRYTTNKLLSPCNPGTDIIVPNVFKDQLDTFLHTLQTNDKSIQWIIVTSAITQQEVGEYRKNFPAVRFIILQRNDGFARTVNIGLNASTRQVLGTVNDDVEISSKTITELSKKIETHIGGINPIIRNTKKDIESAGIKILPIGRAVPQTDTPPAPTLTDALNGACVVFNRNALQRTGLFDERFGSYLEDIDLSLRIKNHGFSLIVDPSQTVIHKGHASSTKILGNKKKWYDARNWIFVIGKNWKRSTLLTYAVPIVIERFRNLSGAVKQYR